MKTRLFKTAIYKLVCPVLLMSIFTSISSGQNSSNTQSNKTPALFDGENILVDYASFKTEDSFSYVEFYLQMSYKLFSFAKNEGEYRAIYEIDLNIEDGEGNFIQSKSAQDMIEVAEYSETISPENHRLGLIAAYLKPGAYRIQAVITDKESGKQAVTVRDVLVRNFSGADLQLSDLQFASKVEIDSSVSPFVKNNRRVEPEVLHEYGHAAGQLFIYFEVYNLAGNFAANASEDEVRSNKTVNKDKPANRMTTTFFINDEEGNIVLRQKLAGKKPGSTCAQSLAVPIKHLPGGQYTLIVRVFDHQSGHQAETSGRFSVYWLPIELKDYTFDEVLQQLRFVANQEEQEQLASLPVSARQQGLIEFWKRRDTTPATSKNEMMEEFYRRIHYANVHFKWEGGEGWKSPQGEIYVAYGPPKTIQRFTSSNHNGINDKHTSSLERRQYERRYELIARPLSGDLSLLFKKRYELWEYHQRDQYFVFADLGGKGIYRLVEKKILGDL